MRDVLIVYFGGCERVYVCRMWLCARLCVEVGRYMLIVLVVARLRIGDGEDTEAEVDISCDEVL